MLKKIAKKVEELYLYLITPLTKEKALRESSTTIPRNLLKHKNNYEKHQFIL